MKPTYEQLEKENQQLKQVIAQQQVYIQKLEERIQKLEAYIQTLEERLKLNSKNSSKPPSTDQKPPHSLLRKGGAKEGHPGHSRAITTPQKVVECKPEKCSRCGSTNLRIGNPWIFQQTELPPIELCITEYRCFRAVCRDCK